MIIVRRGRPRGRRRIGSAEDENFERNKKSIFWFWGGLSAIVLGSVVGMVIADRPRRR